MRGGFRRRLGTGEFVRGYLKEKGPSYVQEMWRAFKSWCRSWGYEPASYESFRSYFWNLKELGLVEKDREEESPFGENRIYYKINPARVDHPAWEDPRGFRRQI